MAERVTKAQIAQLFTVFCNTGGFKMSKGAGDPGLYLDYYSYGGGWQIVEAKPGSTGQYQPLGSRRYSPREFHAVLSFAVNVMFAESRGYFPKADAGPSEGGLPRARNPRRMARRLRRR
jgi:hypothetical protein